MKGQNLPVVLAFCLPCLAQSPVILDLDLENETNYLYDVFDYAKIGSDPPPRSRMADSRTSPFL
jgi:hypothetical protein